MTTQIIAIRNLDFDEQYFGQQEPLLVEKLQSPVRSIVLHAISAAESSKSNSEPIAIQLRMLVEDRDDEVRAKAMIALTNLRQLDELSISFAAKMVDNNVKYVVFAGVFALSSLESVSDDMLEIGARGLVRGLQSCDYEFISLFVAAFNRWLDDPKTHIEQLLQDDQPDYLEMAMEALEVIQEQAMAQNQAS